MKKIVLTFMAFSLIFCSCGNTEDTPEVTFSEALSETSSVSETSVVSETASETEITEPEEFIPCFSYSGDEPCLKTLSEIAEGFPADTVLRYDFSDIDGDLEEELLIFAPHPENIDKCALYVISRDGGYRVSPPLYSFEGNIFAGCGAFRNEAGEYCIAVASQNEKRSKNTAYYMPASLETVSEKEIGFIDSSGFHPENAFREYSIPFYSAEDMTSEELSEKIISELSKTPLEMAQEYADGNSHYILADITGDAFPEMIAVFEEGYVTDMSWCAYDMSGRYPILFAAGILDCDESIKLISDGNGGRKLVSAFTTGCAAQYGRKEAEIFELTYPLQSRRRTLGCEEYYYSYISSKSTTTAYRNELYLDGADHKGRGEYFEVLSESDEYYQNTAFDMMYSDFLSGYDILLEIETDENGKPYLVGDCPEFSERPEINNAPAGVGEAVRYIDVCGEMYLEDSEYITIHAEDIPEDFDFSVLNSFPRLRSLRLTGEAEGIEKIIFSPSDWCRRVINLYVDPLLFEPVGGYSCFENVREICVLGRPDSIDFIADMKSIEVFSCEYAPDYEFLRPLMSLPKLAVIADSGIWSFLPHEEGIIMPEDFRKWLEDNRIIWATVKIG